MFLSSDGVAAAPGRRPGFPLRPGLGAGRGVEGGRTSGAAGAMAPNFPGRHCRRAPLRGPARFLSAQLPWPGKFKSWSGRAVQSPGDEIPGVWTPWSPPAATVDPAFPFRKPQALTPFFQTPAACPPTDRGRRGQDGLAPSLPAPAPNQRPGPAVVPSPPPLQPRPSMPGRSQPPGLGASSRPPPAPPGTWSPSPARPNPSRRCSPARLQSRVWPTRASFCPGEPSVCPPTPWLGRAV